MKAENRTEIDGKNKRNNEPNGIMSSQGDLTLLIKRLNTRGSAFATQSPSTNERIFLTQERQSFAL